jgi:hypothetical protein
MYEYMYVSLSLCMYVMLMYWAYNDSNVLPNKIHLCRYVEDTIIFLNVLRIYVLTTQTLQIYTHINYFTVLRITCDSKT